MVAVRAGPDRARRGALRLAALFLAASVAAPASGGDCRQALVLALDVSASVDAQEYRLQTGGLAAALRDAEVRQAFLTQPERPVWLAVFEWSASGYQRMVIDWVAVEGADVLDRAATEIERTPLPAEQSTTAIGAAMRYAGALFARGPACVERTLDISGDGQNNDWPRPEEARLAAPLSGVTINGLVIGADYPPDHELNPNRMGALTNYYRNRVIKGLGAFVETARDFEDFGETMRRKLVRELSNVMLGAVAPGAAAGSPPLPGGPALRIVPQ